ncbi:hypothetical protein [Ekhidna sp.]|uniref:hypothetical protein n=1 Tax=Ekhidna sp. TaxID=2608089 RepID=UPI003C7D2B27
MNLTDFSELISQLGRYTGIPGIVYFAFFPKKLNHVSGIVFLILLVSFLSDFLGYGYAKYIYANNHGFINTWHLFNCLLAGWFYLRILPEKKKFLIAVLISFVVISVLSFLVSYSFFEVNTIVSTSGGMIIIIFSVISYLQLLKNPSIKLSSLPVFWIITSLFAFSSVMLLIFLFQNYLIFDLQITQEGFASITTLINVANITKNFILFYALVLIDKGYPDTLKPAKAA